MASSGAGKALGQRPQSRWATKVVPVGICPSGVHGQRRASGRDGVASIFFAVRALPDELAPAKVNRHALAIATIDDGRHLPLRARRLGGAAAEHRRIATEAVFTSAGALVRPIGTDEHRALPARTSALASGHGPAVPLLGPSSPHPAIHDAATIRRAYSVRRFDRRTVCRACGRLPGNWPYA
jgi:hypothetical protein